jgi:hypothetical protein
MKYYFPTFAPAKLVRISNSNPPRLAGFTIREATEVEAQEIALGKNYWTPNENGTGLLSKPPIPKYKISKDTIINRIDAAGKLSDAAVIYSSSSDEDKMRYDGNSWFWSDNPRILGLIEALGLNPSIILSRDIQN